MSNGNLHNNPVFKYQPPAVLNQAGPVQNTWYPLLDTTKNTRVYCVTVNIEDTDEQLEVQATVDGEIIAATAFAAVHSTNYMVFKYPKGITRADTLAMVAITTQHFRSAFLLEGKSVKIEIRKTSANGVGNLTGIVIHGKN